MQYKSFAEQDPSWTGSLARVRTAFVSDTHPWASAAGVKPGTSGVKDTCRLTKAVVGSSEGGRAGGTERPSEQAGVTGVLSAACSFARL